jgi:hypothetical protein
MFGFSSPIQELGKGIENGIFYFYKIGCHNSGLGKIKRVLFRISWRKNIDKQIRKGQWVIISKKRENFFRPAHPFYDWNSVLIFFFRFGPLTSNIMEQFCLESNLVNLATPFFTIPEYLA